MPDVSAMTVRAVLFDLGGTLHNYRREEVLHALLKERGLEVPTGDILQSYATIDPIWEELTADLPAQHWWPDSFFEQLDQLILEQLGIQQDQISMARFIRENWNRMDSQLPRSLLRHPYDDVLPCLNSLQGLGVKMGVVSNIPSDQRLQSELEAIRLEGYFSVVISSGAVGVAKPNRFIFELAARKIDENPGEVLFVGDSPWRDYHGAMQAGMKSLLIDRRGIYSDHMDTCRISSLNQIPLILNQNHSSSSNENIP